MKQELNQESPLSKLQLPQVKPELHLNKPQQPQNKLK